MVPVMVATCTTILVLAPLALIPGMGGFLFKPLALAVAFAMLVSFLLSRTFVPMMCARFLPDEHRPGDHGQAGHGHHHTSLFGRLHQHFERFLDHGVVASYSRFLDWALRRRPVVLLGVAVLFVVAVFGLGPRLGQVFYPEVDASQITIYVRAPSNLRLDATEDRIKKVEEFITTKIPLEKADGEEGDLQTMISEIGLDPDWSAAYTPNSGQQDAVIRIQLNVDRPHGSPSAQQYAAMLREELARDPQFKDLRFAFDTGGMVSTALNFGASSPIDVEVSGGTPEQAFDLAKKVRDRIKHEVKGAADVRVPQRLDAPYLFIDVDRQKAASVGLSGADVIQQVVAAMNSSVAISRNFWIDVKSGNQYFVAVQYPEEPGMRLEDVLLGIFATGTDQPNTVKLGSLVRIRRTSGAVEINHTSLYRTYNVLVNTQDRDIASVAGDISKVLKDLRAEAWQGKELPSPAEPEGFFSRAGDRLQGLVGIKKDVLADRDGLMFPVESDPRHAGQSAVMHVKLKGEYERMTESTMYLLGGLAGASLLVYLLQVALFRSWAGPFVIMFTVPLGLIGVVTMLWLTGTTLNVQSEMGVIFLVGIAVNNGVLLIQFANDQRKAGMTVGQAIRSAAAIRLRPILMTFLATTLALLPMSFGLERGSEANIPLGRAVLGGLLTSTALTLFVVPIMYTLLIRDPLTPEVDLEAELAVKPPEVPPQQVFLADAGHAGGEATGSVESAT
jgi:multidrug efflux pump subunit AcrB